MLRWPRRSFAFQSRAKRFGCAKRFGRAKRFGYAKRFTGAKRFRRVLTDSGAC